MSGAEELNGLCAGLSVRESILVVDDDQTLRMLVREILSELKLSITLAENAAEARRLMSSHPFSLVLSDIRMPGDSGVDLLRWAKERGDQTPFILMTGNADLNSLADALNLGAQRFLQKPFHAMALTDTVQEVIRSSRLQRQNEHLRQELSHYNARLRQEVVEANIQNQRLFYATLTSLSNAIDARDAYTCAHSSQVSRLSLALARAMNLTLEQQNAVEIAGQLHDIGKIAIPEHILQKPSRLSAEEFRCIMEHPVSSARILQPLPGFEEILPAVRHHHERYDGTGYPAQLQGATIPTLARIVSVCDTWSAMRTDRPYRGAMPVEEAMAVIRQEQGKQFDPEVAEAFLALVKQNAAAAAML